VDGLRQIEAPAARAIESLHPGVALLSQFEIECQISLLNRCFCAFHSFTDRWLESELLIRGRPHVDLNPFISSGLLIPRIRDGAALRPLGAALRFDGKGSSRRLAFLLKQRAHGVAGEDENRYWPYRRCVIISLMKRSKKKFIFPLLVWSPRKSTPILSPSHMGTAESVQSPDLKTGINLS
jgi:hypothetical protein